MLHLPGVGEPSIHDFLEPSSESLEMLNGALESLKSCAAVEVVRDVEVEFYDEHNQEVLRVHVLQNSAGERGGSVAFTLPDQNNLRVTAGAYNNPHTYLLRSAMIGERAREVASRVPDHIAQWLGRTITILHEQESDYDGCIDQLLEDAPYPAAEHSVYSLGRRLPGGGHITYLHHEGNEYFLEMMQNDNLPLGHTHLIEPTFAGRIAYDYLKYNNETTLTIEDVPAPQNKTPVSLTERIRALQHEPPIRPPHAKFTEANVQRFAAALWSARIALDSLATNK